MLLIRSFSQLLLNSGALLLLIRSFSQLLLNSGALMLLIRSFSQLPLKSGALLHLICSFSQLPPKSGALLLLICSFSQLPPKLGALMHLIRSFSQLLLNSGALLLLLFICSFCPRPVSPIVALFAEFQSIYSLRTPNAAHFAGLLLVERALGSDMLQFRQDFPKFAASEARMLHFVQDLCKMQPRYLPHSFPSLRLISTFLPAKAADKFL
ncbi:hypothetical protein MHH28_31175 [Paenibacillus sp. FSL K6-1217]|uniref:hypothetical protein n=1 Tax=Paenibacillus sp. FSL K6-1217 TaxID=2921466 RepID=UPI003248C5D5